MIRGPWPLSADKRRYDIPLERPYLTPMFNGERVALRVSWDDHLRYQPGRGYRGVITDLDTGKRYLMYGAPCAVDECFCDSTIEEARGGQ